jgi:DNA-binding response OmpR family regulator
MRILLVENDTSIAAFMVEYLTDEGHVVRRVEDHADACRQLTIGSWDLLVIDPGRRPERELAPACGPIPVVLTSAYPWAWRSSATEFKVAAILPKPFDLDTLSATLQHAARA